MKRYVAIGLVAAAMTVLAVAKIQDGGPASEGSILINLVDENQKNLGGYRAFACPTVGEYIKTWQADHPSYNNLRRKVLSVTFVGWQGRHQDVMVKVGPLMKDGDWPTH